MNDAKFAKVLVTINGLIPLTLLGYDTFQGALGANPVNHAIHTTGSLALIFFLLSLSVTPLQKLMRWNAIVAARRPLGLFAFLYAVIHVSIYAALDRALNINSLLSEIATRRYLQFGALAFLLLVPLAITSTDWMIRRLGSKRWKALHRCAYVAAILAVIHYYLQVKADVRMPLVFAAVLAILLLTRVVFFYLPPRRKSNKPRAASAASSALS